MLCPLDNPGGYARVPTGEGDWIWFSDENRERLIRLAEVFKLVWATSWEHSANRIIAPLHGIGELPVIEWSTDALESLAVPDSQPDDWVGYHDWKLPWIQSYAGDRRFAWIDDEVSDRGIAWAAARDRLFVRPAPSIGFTDEHVRTLLAYGRQS